MDDIMREYQEAQSAMIASGAYFDPHSSGYRTANFDPAAHAAAKARFSAAWKRLQETEQSNTKPIGADWMRLIGTGVSR